MSRPENPRQNNCSAIWFRSMRLYLGLFAAGNLAWEIIQLPLYTLWRAGTVWQLMFAVVHCTLGDLLVGLNTLSLALMIFGYRGWPQDRFCRVAGRALVLGFCYTIFSEWLNVVVRASWAYSEQMPIISLFNLKIGLTPMLQWIVVPTAAFLLMRRKIRFSGG